MKIVDLAKKKWKIIKHENLSSRIKTRKETLAFGNIEIKKKKKPYHHQSIFWVM